MQIETTRTPNNFARKRQQRAETLRRKEIRRQKARQTFLG